MRHHPLSSSDRLWLRAIGLAVIAASLLVAAGWIWGLEGLVKWGPGESHMVMNVAVTMGLAGVGFIALTYGRRFLLAGVGVVLMVFIGLNLAQYATSRPLGIFELLWRHQWHGPANAAGRMAPNTAVALALVGLAQFLLALDRARRGFVATIAGVVGALALLPILQYCAWLITDGGHGPYQGMAMPTAFCLILLSTGFLKLEHEAADSALPFMSAALGMLFSIGAIAVQANRELLEANRLVAHSYQVRGDVDRFVEEIARAESSSRAFALTGEPLFRLRVPVHEAEASQLLAKLRELTSDNPSQLARIERLQALAGEKFSQNEALLRFRQSGGLAEAGKYLRDLLAEPGQPTSNLVLLADATRQEEDRLLNARMAAQVSVERNTRLAQIAGSITAVALLLGAAVLTRRASVARRAAEAQFRGSFEDAGIGMALVGLDGRWLRVNRTLVELLGYSEAELAHRTFQDITHPDDLAADLQHVQDLLDGRGRTYQMEKRYRHKDGHTVWGNLTVSLVRNAHGAPAHFISQVEDISAHKRLEEELRSARDDALAAARTKSDFLAAMSHEIRTPMNGIIGMAALLEDFPMPPDQKDMVQVINQSADSLLGIINDILDISKMEAGKFSIDPEEFNLGDLLKSTVALLAPKAAQKRVGLHYRIDPALAPPLIGDSRRIRQILTNLIGNAIKFTDRGEVTVSVDAIEIAAGTVTFKVAVQDTGLGIAPQAQQRLFQPFVQVDASAEKRFGGTGLGLAICRQLVDLMAGKIGVDSEPGKGAKFWFTLTLPWAARPEPGAKSSRHPFRVLVVDDSPEDRELTILLLTEMGLQAKGAAGGAAGLAELRAAPGSPPPWDMLLVDQQMPGMNGLDFGRTVKQDAALRAIPLVLMSGGALQAPSEASLIGFESFVSKPVRADQFLRILRRFMPVPPAGATDQRPAPRAESLARKSGAPRILVVDDHDANRSVARLTLAKLGLDVDLAESGAIALQKLAVGHFDAVLMDCQMPELSGYETTRRIRSGATAGIDPKIPIIALTAYAMAGDLERCREAGMDDYLSKPLRAAELREALARRGVHLDPPSPPPAPAPSPEPASLVDARHITEMQALPGQHGPSLWPELVATFFQQAPGNLSQMEALLQGRERVALASAAHRFAGSCAGVGAAEGRVLALEIEKFSAAEDWPALTARVGLLRAAYDRFAAVVLKFYPSL